jgi:CDGSH-type Zn-finger protein/uncharacterized Fe-S cluster protein YjdI
MTEDTPYEPSREHLIHALYEAAELEHNLMCTYLYAAFSLKAGVEEGLSPAEAEAVARWRRTILEVAIDEMGHLTAVWNITAALGGAPRFGRGNFPLDPGALPAGVVVKLAPFSEAVLQHFIHLERPEGSTEPDGDGFEPDFRFTRASSRVRLTPMPIEYATVGVFYATLGDCLREFVAAIGEDAVFCGDPALQLSEAEVAITGSKPVICIKTALAAFDRIIQQGEGAPSDAVGSHYSKFIGIRTELVALKAANRAFEPAWPAAVNPVLRAPVRQQKRVWIEDSQAFATVDIANTCYMLMLRLLAYSYTVRRPSPEKSLAVDLAVGLMAAATHLAERAARLPAGPSNPDCNAGMSFTALRDAAPLLAGPSARQFFTERLQQIADASAKLAAGGDARMVSASRILADLARRGIRGFAAAGTTTHAGTAANAGPLSAAGVGATAPAAVPGATPIVAALTPTPANGNVANGAAMSSASPPVPRTVDGVDYIEGKDLTLIYEGKKCIHARFCVTWGPKVFLANVKGPWIHPDAMETERLAEIAHVCPSGAIRYERKDGVHDEQPPQVNLVAVREGGPYAVRAQIMLDGEPAHFRATLCRCGASKNKPFCDGSHHEVKFDASGEPPTGKADMLPVRDGPLAIDPQTDGPLQVRGNLEITSGTGRVVARVVQTRLCRCGGSANKPFCDGTHARIGFKST